MRYDLKGKVALVTGATGGIGFEIAKGLAQLGARVLIHGRNQEKIEQRLEALPRLKDDAQHQGFCADLSSLKAVETLSAQVSASTNSLDILINNAGLWTPEKKLSQDGYELQFAVNHLAPFLLMKKLQPTLRTAQGARVINIASAMHLRAHLNFDDLMFDHRRYSGIDAYAQSKLAMVMVTRDWAHCCPV